MKLFTVCMTVFMFTVFACSDDTDQVDTVDAVGTVDAADVADVSSADVSLGDTSNDDDVSSHDAVDTGHTDVADTVSDIGGAETIDVANVEEDAVQLPEDPTEDPEGESSFYEFPAWEIPPSDNDGNR